MLQESKLFLGISTPIYKNRDEKKFRFQKYFFTNVKNVYNRCQEFVKYWTWAAVAQILDIDSLDNILGAFLVKTTRPVFALILTAALVLLWTAPYLTSETFNTSRFTIDFCLFMVTYLMLVRPDLFSSIARSRKRFTSRASA